MNRPKLSKDQEARVMELALEADRIWNERKPPVSREAVLLAMLILLVEDPRGEAGWMIAP